MNAFQAYMTFVALKRHFAPGSTYDYHKYCGKVNVKHSSFESRSDKYWYEKLAKMRDPLGFMIANISENPKLWVGDLFSEEAEQRYVRWTRVTESLMYTLKSEMSKVEPGSGDTNEHPPLLKAYLAGEVSPEVLCALDKFMPMVDNWLAQRGWDPSVRQSVHRVQKLRGFIEVDVKAVRAAITKIATDKITEGLMTA